MVCATYRICSSQAIRCPGVPMSTESRPLIILNPTADRGAAAARLPAITAWAETYKAEVALTGGPGDATRLAQEAARAGRTPIVAVGGDGTIHEVAVGILSTGCH